jgi:cyclic pyranopterin phosphate synthase
MEVLGYLLHDGRAHALAARVCQEADSPSLRISRAVIFLTAHCNMECSYCKSVDHRMPVWRRGQVTELLDRFAAAGTQHVHWTGGEPSLHPQLLDFVQHSAGRGMNNSIATNGAGPAQLYLRLADAGMSRFYLSVDALDPGKFDQITGSRGNLSRVLQTLSAL